MDENDQGIVETRPTPWWRKVAAYASLAAIFAFAWWWTKFADQADAAQVAAATPGYVSTLIVIAGAMVALLVGVYDLGRLRYLSQVHQATTAAASRSDDDKSSRSGGYD